MDVFICAAYYLSYDLALLDKTTQNENIIGSIMHSMHAKCSCDSVIKDERDDTSIIGRYRIIAHTTRKINVK
jgi:hypothetical protein